MTGVLLGFVVVGAVIFVGYVLARSQVLGSQAIPVLSALTFTVALPALLFHAVATSPVGAVFSSSAAASIGSAVAIMALFLLIGLVRRWGVQRMVTGALSSGYVNSSNIGIPLSTYILGSATFVTPIMLFQLAILTPVALTILDLASPAAGHARLSTRVTAPLRNPVTIAAVLGVVVSATGWRVPEVVLGPIDLIAQSAVPLMLITFGMTLHRQARLASTPEPGALTAVVLKALAHPLLAFVVAEYGLRLSSREVFVVVCCALLPTGQNVVTYAVRYDAAPRLAQVVALVTTVTAAPLLLVAAAIWA